jgi:hypothetical protein
MTTAVPEMISSAGLEPPRCEAIIVSRDRPETQCDQPALGTYTVHCGQDGCRCQARLRLCERHAGTAEPVVRR